MSETAESSGRPPSDVRNAHNGNALTTTTTTRELSPYRAEVTRKQTVLEPTHGTPHGKRQESEADHYQEGIETARS